MTCYFAAVVVYLINCYKKRFVGCFNFVYAEVNEGGSVNCLKFQNNMNLMF